MSKLKVLELFGGIGACSKALEKLNIDFEIVDYVEIDKYAVKSFNAIHNTNFETQDITKWNKDLDVDLIMHGSPCQDFSLSGKQAGGDKDSGTRSSLMYETVRIVNKLKPKYVIWENVKNLLSKKHIHNFNNYIDEMNKLGYNSFYQVLNAKDYGIPQNRERVFTISIRNDIDKVFVFPNKQELKLKLKDILEDEVEEKYYLSEKQLDYVLDNNDVALKSGRNINSRIVNPSIAKTLSCRGATDQRADITNFIIDNENEEITVKDLKLKIKNNNLKGYQEAYEGDSVNLSYPNSKTRRGRVGNQVSQTIQCNDNIGVVINKTICLNSKSGRNGIEGLQPSRKDRIYDSKGIATTIATSDFYNPNYYNNLRIRKITPKEAWLLMGFDTSDFNKASQVCSNTQLYKQAGNSIVVNVLEAILKNLILRGEIK